MKRIFSSILALLILSTGVALAYQSPGNPTGFVNDYTETLSASDKSAIENTLINFKNETTNEIVIVLISNLSGDTIENFANELFREWGIGDGEKNNGILVLIAKDERKARIEVGYGLEGAVPDILAKRILDDEILSQVKEGNYSIGLTQGVNALMSATRGEYIPTQHIDNTDETIGFSSAIVFFVLILFSWLAAILGRSKSWWAGGIIGGIIGLVNIVFNLLGTVLFLNIFFGIGSVLFGLLFDYVVSKGYTESLKSGNAPPWWTGGGRGGGSSGSGGGFGGFGGGSSGGGGASSSW